MSWDFPGGPEVKNLPCSAGDVGWFLVGEPRPHMPQSNSRALHLLSPHIPGAQAHNWSVHALHPKISDKATKIPLAATKT